MGNLLQMSITSGQGTDSRQFTLAASSHRLAGETYDANGNRTSGTADGFTSVSYNILNLPETVTTGGRTINYLYSARWSTPDPLSEKYYSISPYAYCAGNPVNLVDPEGKKYTMSIEDNQITIKAVYYTLKDDAEYIQKATEYFNNLSGKYYFTDGDGKQYKVVFELSVEIVEDENNLKNSGLNMAIGRNPDSGNTFQILPDESFNESTNGKTRGGRDIAVRNSRKDSSTVLHEVGHTLGWNHTVDGLMKSTADRSNDSIYLSSISEMIINAAKGIVPSSTNNNSGGSVGAGKVIMGNSLITNSFLQGCVKK